MESKLEDGGTDDPRRVFPWVSLTLALACVVGFGAAWVEGREVRVAVDAAFGEASDFFTSHPFLAAPPTLRERMGSGEVDTLAAEFHQDRERRGAPALPPRVVARHQATLDEMVAVGNSELAKSPLYRFGLIPARPRLAGRFGHPFVHRHSLHLFGNVALLLALGCFLESVWGAVLFAVVVSGVTVASGAAFGTSAPELAAPFIGASAVVAGLLGAFAVRFWPERGEMPYGWIVTAGVAWSVLPLAAGDVWSVARSSLTGAESAALGVQSHWALLGGFAAGLLASGTIGLLRIEQWVVHRVQESRRTGVENTTLDEALQARREGRLRDAFDLLSRAQRDAPTDHDVALAMWDVASELGRNEDAAAAMLRLIRDELDRGEARQAAEHWQDFCSHGLDHAADSGLLIRMAGALRVHGSDTSALSALQSALARAPETAVPSVATRVAHAAADLDAEVAAIAAWRALGSTDLALDQRQSLEDLLGRLRPSPEVESEAIEFGGAASQPRRRRDEIGLPAVEDLTDALGTGARPAPAASPRRRAGDLPDDDPRALEIVAATPIAYVTGELTVDCGVDGKLEIDPADIEIISVAAVAGLASKPVILIDLVTRAMSLGDEPLRIVRLSADHFDPRTLSPGTGSQVEALRTFLEWLSQESRADPLPDPRAAVGRPFATFESLEVYETEVLGHVDSSDGLFVS